jgi:hypothetical protein
MHEFVEVQGFMTSTTGQDEIRIEIGYATHRLALEGDELIEAHCWERRNWQWISNDNAGCAQKLSREVVRGAVEI